ncbi:hypothetical protein EVAR_69512_1 [Eumeta japonica]|uniref:Uncharacterized protein n=1 Tax=Eumeta variegata TaxID=151549 RepID=A0A4C2A8M5_EUMVA|nr:hypothetical protein EVAR_69512_1 [Eumeta japonica]
MGSVDLASAAFARVIGSESETFIDVLQRPSLMESAASTASKTLALTIAGEARSSSKSKSHLNTCQNVQKNRKQPYSRYEHMYCPGYRTALSTVCSHAQEKPIRMGLVVRIESALKVGRRRVPSAVGKSIHTKCMLF